jgi:RNA polymerase sigma factor (sigma-70 family)
VYQKKIPLREFVEQFFTFLMPLSDHQGHTYALQWRSEAALKHHFTLYKQTSAINQACQREEADDIVQSLLQTYHQDSTSGKQRVIVQWHLAAYLEEPVYKAVGDRLSSYRDYNSPEKTWEHYLHIAQCLAADAEKILEIYRRYKPGKDSLAQHFRLELASKIRDVFHQETGQGKYSLWYGLKRVSDRELSRRLCLNGIEASKIQDYLAVRDALFDIYSKVGDRWVEPSGEQYQQATDYFNRHYAKPGSSLDPERFQFMVRTCVKANQAAPAIESLDDEKHKTLVTQENFLMDSPLTQLEEEQSSQALGEKRQQIDRLVFEQLQQLEDQDRAMVELHAQGLNQTQIAAKLGVNQGTVSRRYQRSQRQLLTAIAQALQTDYSLIALEHLAIYIELVLSRQYTHNAPESPIPGEGIRYA